MRRWSDALPRPARVLDLGCGHGFELARMSNQGLQPVGLDLSLGMLRLARRRAGDRLVQGDAIRLPFSTATLDGVWSLHALLHVADLRGAVHEVGRVLRPGGLAALTIALGDGTTTEPVQQQPDVLRQFMHRSEQTTLEAVHAAELAVVDAGVDTDGRSTLWLLAERR